MIKSPSYVRQETGQGMINTGCVPAIRARPAMDGLGTVLLIGEAAAVQGDAAAVQQEGAHFLGKP